MIFADGILRNAQGIRAPTMVAAMVNHVLLLEHDISEAWFIQLTLARTGWTDILLWHEATLSRGLTLLDICEFRLILLGVSLPELPLHAVLRAIGHRAAGTPVIVMHELSGGGIPTLTASENPLAHVRAVVGQRDVAGILSAVRSTLGPWEISE